MYLLIKSLSSNDDKRETEMYVFNATSLNSANY